MAILNDAAPTTESLLRRRASVGRRVAAWTAAVLAGVAVAATALWLAQNTGSSARSLGAAGAPARVDLPAPDFKLEVLGEERSLAVSDFRGSVVVVNFWASWCTPCRSEAPGLEATWRDYRRSGVRFLGIDELDDEAAGLAFVREFGLTYPSVSDPAGSLSDDFSLIGLPETFVIDATGTIRYRFSGFVDEAALRSVLDGLLDG